MRPTALSKSPHSFRLVYQSSQDNVLLKGPGGSVKLADFGMSMATHITEPDSDVICGEVSVHNLGNWLLVEVAADLSLIESFAFAAGRDYFSQPTG